MSTARQILETAYQRAQQGIVAPLSASQQLWLKTIVENAESHKAILTVVISSLTRKIEAPAQDIRQHKIELPGGYSGRSYDFNYVTPFLQEFFQRYAMAESGWLTRSIEQVHPFTFDFPGKIRNAHVKQAFLEVINDVQVNQVDASSYLQNIFALLLEHQKLQQIQLPSFSEQSELSIGQMIQLLEQHFFEKYQGAGASRLPVIALYSIYQLMINHPRYLEKQLLPLKSHTTSDTKSTSLGDIEIVNADGSFFEIVEVKHQKPITVGMLRLAYEKFRYHPVKRYYLLTTKQPETNEAAQILAMTEKIQQEHGCEVIVNGLIPTIKYYLRLLENPSTFMAVYSKNLEADYQKGSDIKQVHLAKWFNLLEGN